MVKLFDLISTELSSPYRLGSDDCFFMACRIVDFQTGSSLNEKYAGLYTNLLGAQRALKKRKFNSLVEFWKKHFEEIPPAHCRQGDIAVVEIINKDGKGEEHCSIFYNGFVTKQENGTFVYGCGDVKAAFRVK